MLGNREETCPQKNKSIDSAHHFKVIHNKCCQIGRDRIQNHDLRNCVSQTVFEHWIAEICQNISSDDKDSCVQELLDD